MGAENDLTNDTAAESAEKTIEMQNKGAESQEGKSPLDEILADESKKAAYDKAVEDAVTAALEQRAAADAEAKRLESLSDEEKRAEREKELETREAKLQAAEFRSQAIIEFEKNGIPSKLADCLNYSDKDNFEKSKTAAAEAFKEAVQAGVNARIRGKDIPAAAGAEATKSASGVDDLRELIKQNQAKR